jgi:hypothetical protein
MASIQITSLLVLPLIVIISFYLSPSTVSLNCFAFKMYTLFLLFQIMDWVRRVHFSLTEILKLILPHRCGFSRLFYISEFCKYADFVTLIYFVLNCISLFYTFFLCEVCGLTTALLKGQVFWDVSLCRPGEVPGFSKDYNAIIFRIMQSSLFLPDSEDEDIMIFLKTGSNTHLDTASHPRRLKSAYSLYVYHIFKLQQISCFLFSILSDKVIYNNTVK